MQIRQQEKSVDEENLVVALFIHVLCNSHSWPNSKWRIQKGTHGEKMET